MQTDPLIIIASAAAYGTMAQAIAARMRSLGLRVWSINDDVGIGDSKIKALDQKLQEAVAMVLLRASAKKADDWTDRQEFAFRARLTWAGDLKLFVVPQADGVIERSLQGHALVLPPWIDANQVAELAAAAVRFSPKLSSVRARLPDNPNGPLLSAGAWPLQSPETHFDQAIGRMFSLNGVRYYDEISDLYWNSLHFSGYRGRWDIRLNVSEHLSRLAKSQMDSLNCGLILTKGIAYAHLTLGNHVKAFSALKSADLEFRDARHERGRGFCSSYFGDIEVQRGRISHALDCYKEAADALSGLEQYNVILKAKMVGLLHEDGGVPSRLRSLHRLKHEFREVHNYRAGIIDMAIAEMLGRSGDYSQALAHAASSVNLFRDVINMPRNTRRAEALYLAIVERRPPLKGDGQW
ncbi:MULTISPECIES: hypothetical protein [unclassified Bradyrhizobium]